MASIMRVLSVLVRRTAYVLRLAKRGGNATRHKLHNCCMLYVLKKNTNFVGQDSISISIIHHARLASRPLHWPGPGRGCCQWLSGGQLTDPSVPTWYLLGNYNLP
jgi:hypothetical protein